MKKQKDSIIKLFAAPSSDTEREYEDLTYMACIKKAKKLKDTTAQEFLFESTKELKAFIKGYEYGVGYLGNGFWHLKD
jgi:hypothetical protein